MTSKKKHHTRAADSQGESNQPASPAPEERRVFLEPANEQGEELDSVPPDPVLAHDRAVLASWGFSLDDDEVVKAEGIPLVRIRGPFDDDECLAHAVKALDAIEQLTNLSTSPVAREARAVAEAMIGTLLADGYPARVVRDAHKVVLGGQPGKDAGAKIRLVGEWLASAASKDGDDDDHLSGVLATVDPAFGSERCRRVLPTILARYRARKRTQASLIQSVTELLAATGALATNTQNARTTAGHARLLERVKKALQRAPKAE